MLTLTKYLVCFAVLASVLCEPFVDVDRYANLPFGDAIKKFSNMFGSMPEVIKQMNRDARFNFARGQVKEDIKKFEKRPAISKQSEVCPHSVGGYHVLLTNYAVDPSDGATECAKYGWQYAIVTDDSWEMASWTIANCTDVYVGLRSYNGFQETGCQLMHEAGIFLFSLDDTECTQILSFPLLCQEGPLEQTTVTIIDSTLTTTVITDITLITTPTITPTTTPSTTSSITPSMKLDWNRGVPEQKAGINKAELARKRRKQLGELVQQFDVCTSTHNGLHMVYDAFFYNDAPLVCSDLGWHVADIDQSNAADVLNLFNDCQPLDVLFNINSFGGVAAGQCRLAYILPWYNVWGLNSVNPTVCYFLAAPVICQEAPSTATVTVGTASATTVSLTSTEIEPIATTTLTETVTI